jgi:hypothetical protein
VGNQSIDNTRSEPSKWVPIGISLFALLISCVGCVISFLSWRESHRGRLINEAVNRPIVTVDTNGEALARWAKEGSGEFLVRTLFVTSEIKNLGKTAAIINKVDHEIMSFGECELGEVSDVDFQALVGKEVVPNVTLRAGQAFPILTACEGEKIYLISEGVIYYTDTATGIPYEQRFFRGVSVPYPTPVPSPFQ